MQSIEERLRVSLRVFGQVLESRCATPPGSSPARRLDPRRHPDRVVCPRASCRGGRLPRRAVDDDRAARGCHAHRKGAPRARRGARRPRRNPDAELPLRLLDELGLARAWNRRSPPARRVRRPALLPRARRVPRPAPGGEGVGDVALALCGGDSGRDRRADGEAAHGRLRGGRQPSRDPEREDERDDSGARRECKRGRVATVRRRPGPADGHRDQCCGELDPDRRSGGAEDHVDRRGLAAALGRDEPG